jgi:hypothetical protein
MSILQTLHALLWPFTLLGLALVWMMASRSDPAHDKTARFMNAVACVWAALKQRNRLYQHVVLENYANDKVLDLEDGVVVKVRVSPATEVYATVRRPYAFLSRDWMESMGFRKDDGRVT